MKNKTKQYDVFLVDNDLETHKIVTDELKGLGCKVSCFTNADDCIKPLSARNCNLLITEIKMHKMDGLTLLDKVNRIAPWVSVMIVTGCGDIPTAVEAIKKGAVDFIEKPLDKAVFAQKVKSILSWYDTLAANAGQILTKTEKKVLKMILDGKSNKEMAYALGRSLRTVELHRSHIMQKLNVDNLVNLVKKTAFMGMGYDK